MIYIHFSLTDADIEPRPHMENENKKHCICLYLALLENKTNRPRSGWGRKGGGRGRGAPSAPLDPPLILDYQEVLSERSQNKYCIAECAPDTTRIFTIEFSVHH